MATDNPPWMIVSACVRNWAGQGKPVLSLINNLVRRGCSVHLAANDVEPEVAALPGVTVHLTRKVRGAEVVGNLILHRRGRRLVQDFSAAHPKGIVLVNGGNCLWADVNWVHYVHHAYVPSSVEGAWYYRAKERVVGAMYRRQERQAINAAKLVITNSQRTRDDVIRYLGTNPERVRNIYYGCDSHTPAKDAERLESLAKLQIAGERPVVVFVGGFGLDGRKGFDTLLDAWSILCREKNWDAELLMAGGGRAIESVRNRISAKSLSGSVRLLGFIQEIPALLAAADLLVSPVRYEPYGLNVQEALGRGVPAIVSAVAGVAERYPADLRALVLDNHEDPQELASRMRLWRSDVEGWRRRFAPFSDELRRRSWSDMADELIDLVLANRR